MCACESEDLPAVPGAPRPAAHRLVELGVRLSWLQDVLTAHRNQTGFASAGGDQFLPVE